MTPPPQPETAFSQPGDLWILGRHRLLCGDSTVVDDVRRVMAGERASLMATDPPYLVDYKGDNHPQSWQNKAAGQVNNKHWDDYNDPAAAAEFFVSFLRIALDEALTERPFVYQWFADMRTDLVWESWKTCGLLQHQQVIWVKARPVLTRRMFMQQHEPCMVGWVKGKRPDLDLFPPQNERSVWQIDQRGESDGIHPTQKPVEVVRRPIEWHTKPGQRIYEPFSGSGTAIIAAERTGRGCSAIEKSPVFVDVAARRWQEHTGEKPVLERTGEPHDFTDAP